MKELVVETQKLRDNLKIVREIAEKNNPETKIIAVIKGNGYGLGLVEYAQFLADNGVDFFAVATVEEAIKLRENGIKQDILMMSSTAVKEDVQTLIENNIILTIGSKESGETVDEVAQELNQKVRVHLKIDTGFGRYGFIYNKSQEIINAINSWQNIQIEGVFSHFSIAFFGDGKESRQQYDRFLECVQTLKDNNIEPSMLHICNSSAFLRFPEMHLNAVRVGSVLLGRLSIPNKWGFKKVGYLKSNVADIKTLPAGYNIGYSNSFTTKKETKIAIVPCGYADGFNVKVDRDMFRPIDKLRYIIRDIKDSFKKQQINVTINGEKFKVLGRLGMFHVSVDVTEKSVKVNDEVRFEVSPMLVDSNITRTYL
ncbi:MAG: alanine racemase [Clostridia bacterium]|nr:alanine racemase [Clostridia bacterium]